MTNKKSLILASTALLFSVGAQAQMNDGYPPMPPMGNPQMMEHHQQMMERGGMGMGGPMMMNPEMRERMMQRREQMMGQGGCDHRMHQQHHPMQGPGPGGAGKMQMKREMMQKRMEHMQAVEERLANIEKLLQQLVEQGKEASPAQ